jgi:flagellar basal-body rod modification protein FlgD
LQILAAELQNQDPTSTQDTTQYVAQMAQFTSLEEMQTLNQSIDKLLLTSKFQEGSLMIGKTATISTGSDSKVTAEITGVKMSDGNVVVTAGGKDYSIDDVISLEASTQDQGSV